MGGKRKNPKLRRINVSKVYRITRARRRICSSERLNAPNHAAGCIDKFSLTGRDARLILGGEYRTVKSLSFREIRNSLINLIRAEGWPRVLYEASSFQEALRKKPLQFPSSRGVYTVSEP